MRLFKPGHAATILATISAALALTCPALAANGFGPLSGPNGCLVATGSKSGSENGTSGCGAGKGLIGAGAVAVSGDGANVYVVGGTAGNNVASSFGSLVVLKRDQSSGSISELECLSSDGTDGHDGASGACVPTPSLLGADGVSVSPDGRTVFVVSGSSASVVAFARNLGTGSLTRLGCFQDAPRPGSPCTPANVFEGSDALVTSAAGNALYVAAPLNGTISTFTPAATTRVGAGGPSAGTSTSTSAAGTSTGSSSGAGSGSSGAGAEAATGAGSGAGAAGTEASVASMFTAPASTVFLANPCIAVNGLDGACSVGVAMRGLDALALSPDGRQLYGAAPTSGAVDVFTPSANGMLAQSGCIMRDAPVGLCRSSSLLETPSSLAISPDGKNVYVVDSSHESGRLDELSRNPSTGALSDVGCVEDQPPPRELTQEEKEEQQEEEKNGEREPEGEPSHPAGPCQSAPGLGHLSAVAVSGDGAQVYAIGDGTAAIFTRDPSTGSLSESACAASEDSRCTSLPSLSGVAGAAVSPDGRQVYVAASKSNAVMVFGIGAAISASAPSGTSASAGVARVRVACPSGLRLPCSGTLELTRIVSRRGKHHGHRRFQRVQAGTSGRFVVGPGRVATVRVRLSRRARRLLESQRHLRTMAVVRAVPAGGGSGYGRPLLLHLRAG